MVPESAVRILPGEAPRTTGRFPSWSRLALRDRSIRILRLLGRIAVRILRVVILLAIVGLIAGTWAAFWFERNILATLPKDLSELREWRPPTACRVYAADGLILDQFYVERRIWVDIDELPEHVWGAFIAAEDRRFLDHKGVDLQGIARALLHNLQTGTVGQGGSTITQQLVKNIIVGKERSYRRKLGEAVLAVRLEKELSKEKILELYLNFIALGSGNYGVEAASQDYFGLSAREIDIGQAALLAGLVPAPSRYSPRVNPEAAALRRGYVLDAMAESGQITTEQASMHRLDPVLLHQEGGPSIPIGAAYATQTRREIRKITGENTPFKAGFQVYTPMIPKVQERAEAALRRGIEALQEREGRQGALRHIEPSGWQAFLRRGTGLPRDTVTYEIRAPRVGECFQALVGEQGVAEALRAGSGRYRLLDSEWELPVRVTGQDEKKPPKRPESLRKVTIPGDILRVCVVDPPPQSPSVRKSRNEKTPSFQADAWVRLDPRPWSEGAVVVIENATGHVLALVGGYDARLEGFVRATQARRQPGSSFKPYVYATALLGGRTQLSRVLDGPLALPAGGGRYWSPKNYSGGYAGWLPLRFALARSLNTVSVRLTLETGAAEVARVAKAMGVKTPLRHDPTIALGSSELTPMDQAVGFSTIARLGVPAEPVYIERVVDVFGREAGRAGGPIRFGELTFGELPGAAGPRALPTGIAYELADMMREVVRSGTARKALKKGFDRAGKTGTTNGFLDAWYVGFTPYATIAVWVGTDGTTGIGESETGGRVALPIWMEVAETLQETEGELLPVPDDALLVPVLGTWVGIPAADLPPEIQPIPDPGAAPLPYPSRQPGRAPTTIPSSPTSDEWLYGLPD